MNKKEIFEKLDTLDFDKNDYLIIGGASLVCQGIIKETSDIDLSCSRNFYDKLSWEEKKGYFDWNIKYNDCFEIGYNFYKDEYVEINGYHFMNLNDLLELKKEENKSNDKSLIKKIQLKIDLEDTYQNEVARSPGRAEPGPARKKVPPFIR